jgi:type 1 glutamine amidotransferase
MDRSTRRMLGRSLAAAALALALSAWGSALEAQQGQQGGQQGPPNFAGQPRIRALVVAGGCCHDYPTQTAILMKAVQRALPVDWTFEYPGGTNGAHVPAFYNDPNWFRGYDIVVHNECFTPADSLVSERYLENIQAATKAGVPGIVLHCAMHSFRAEPTDQWREVQGLKSVRHGPATRIPVRVAAASHPIMEGIPSDWVTPVDEIYIIDWTRPGLVPLATAVEPSNGQTYPVIWTHQNGARVFGTSIGHSMATWEDPNYQRLLVQGFRWAVGR